MRFCGGGSCKSAPIKSLFGYIMLKIYKKIVISRVVLFISYIGGKDQALCGRSKILYEYSTKIQEIIVLIAE